METCHFFRRPFKWWICSTYAFQTGTRMLLEIQLSFVRFRVWMYSVVGQIVVVGRKAVLDWIPISYD
ncbi:hypothetical protein KIN20_031251 [Parelaphostrongylus tenuis]|uniref:Uncharacterized protein n=1 Tax=Parelaphostrongylus tenuis TaxID=148309 RepID=A0AAD5WH48_PARTN|nr:hypothetical protein KIN20_031251 [Parelaphostrongylus tenuis]